MIEVTREAKDLFLQVDHPEGTVLRLDPLTDQTSGETQIGISAGTQQEGDQVVEHEGEELLYIAAPVSDALDGSTLDRVETPEGPGIGIAPPEQPS
jgi:hypothetical protein